MSILLSIPCFSNAPPTDKMNTARRLLATLRGGDYAHAGDKEAIDIVLKEALSFSPQIQKEACLDVGSGFGGTANYIYSLGFHSIHGIDLDPAATTYAQKHYPWIQFLTADAHDVVKLFKPESFSFIYMFNVLYAIEDKSSLLKKLYSVAEPGAILVLFDYTTQEISLDLTDLAGKPMYPLVVKELEKNLTDAGWQTIEIKDLSSLFLVWYRDLLNKIENEEAILSATFSEADIAKVKATFTTIYNWLKLSQLGGAVIYARKPDGAKSDMFSNQKF